MRVLCLGLYPIFLNWIICSFDDQFLELFVYFGDQTSVWCGVGEDLFPVCRLSFCLVECVLCFSKLFIFRSSHLLIVSLNVYASKVIYRKSSPVPGIQVYFPISLLWCSVWLVLYWGIWFNLIWVLCIVVDMDQFYSSTWWYPVMSASFLKYTFFIPFDFFCFFVRKPGFWRWMV